MKAEAAAYARRQLFFQSRSVLGLLPEAFHAVCRLPLRGKELSVSALPVRGAVRNGRWGDLRVSGPCVTAACSRKVEARVHAFTARMLTTGHARRACSYCSSGLVMPTLSVAARCESKQGLRSEEQRKEPDDSPVGDLAVFWRCVELQLDTLRAVAEEMGRGDDEVLVQDSEKARWRWEGRERRCQRRRWRGWRRGRRGRW